MVLTAEASGQPRRKAGKERYFTLRFGEITQSHLPCWPDHGAEGRAGDGMEKGLLTIRLTVLTAEMGFCNLKACRYNFCSNKTRLTLAELLALLVSWGMLVHICPWLPGPDQSCLLPLCSTYLPSHWLPARARFSGFLFSEPGDL